MSGSTPSVAKRLFVGADAAYAQRVPPEDLFHVAGPFGPIFRISSDDDGDTTWYQGALAIGAEEANYLVIAGGSVGNPITATATGADTNIPISIQPKGSGYIYGPRLSLSASAPGGTDTYRRLNVTASGTLATGQTLVRIGGNWSASSLAASQQGSAMVVAIDSDTINFADADHGATMLYNAMVLRSGWNGGRTLSTDLLFLGRSSNPGEDNGTSGFNSYLVAGASFVRTYSGSGGAPGATRGNYFGRNDSVEVFNGTGGHVNSLFGNETDLAIENEVVAMWKGAYKAVLWKHDYRRGMQQDFAYSLGMQANGAVASTAPGFLIAYAIGGVEGWFPLTETSAVMRPITGAGIADGPNFAIAQGIDFSELARIRASAFKSLGFQVDGTGRLGALIAGGVALQTRGPISGMTATVSSVEVIDGGLYSSGSVALTADAPTTSGTTATVTVAAMALMGGNAIPAPGSNYAVGDTFEVDTGTGTVTAAAEFTGTIDDNVLTVSAVASGTIVNNSFIAGTNIIHNTKIIAFGTGAGGTGTYILDTSQKVTSATTITSNGNPRGIILGVTGGQVTRFRITNPGRFTVTPSVPLATTALTGGGSGFTFSPLYTMLAATVSGAGTNYSGTLPPRITPASANQLRPATFKVTMAETPAPVTINGGFEIDTDGSLEIGGGNFTVDASSGDTNIGGDLFIGNFVDIGGDQVVTTRRTGWAAATGTATRTTFATGSVTTAQLAERVKALIDDLTTHGLIGA